MAWITNVRTLLPYAGKPSWIPTERQPSLDDVRGNSLPLARRAVAARVPPFAMSLACPEVRRHQSVGNPERIRNVARRVIETQRAGHRVVVVVSAMSGVTDGLIKLAREVSPAPVRTRDGRAPGHRRTDHHRAAGHGDPRAGRARAFADRRAGGHRHRRRPHQGQDRQHHAQANPRRARRRPGRHRRRFPGADDGRADDDPRPGRLGPDGHRPRLGRRRGPVPDFHRRGRRLHLRPAPRAQRPPARRSFLRGNARNGQQRQQGHAVALGRIRQEIRREIRGPHPASTTTPAP